VPSIGEWNIADLGFAEPKQLECALRPICGAHSLPSSANFLAAEVAPKVGQFPISSRQVLVAAGEPAASYLIAKLRNSAGICGAPMPRNRPALSEEQIQLIEAWIGALPH